MSSDFAVLRTSLRPFVLLFGLLTYCIWSVVSPVSHTHEPVLGVQHCVAHPGTQHAYAASQHCISCDWEALAGAWQTAPEAPTLLSRPRSYAVPGATRQLVSRETAGAPARGPPAGEFA